jgi:hypothetical protein
LTDGQWLVHEPLFRQRNPVAAADHGHDPLCAAFRCWSADGPWDDRLRDLVRVAEGRDLQPSAAALDSQTAHSHEGGEAIGGDAGKRKRHPLVDTGGLLLKAVVHADYERQPAHAEAARRLQDELHQDPQ